MTKADYDDFTTVLRAFAEIKGKPLSAPAIELYWRAMQDWDIGDFKAAAAQLLKTLKFFPTPADFEALRHAGRPTCGEAWTRVRNHVKTLSVRGGYLQAQPCGDSLIDAAVAAIGGWEAIGQADLVAMQFLERRFCERYEEFTDVKATRQALPQLAAPESWAERARRLEGLPRPQ